MEKKSNTPKKLKATLDEVDEKLLKEDGSIPRSKSSSCNHGSRSKCAHCLPFDPFDETYLLGKDIKHMSFHAYIRQCTQGISRGKGNKFSYPLENLICRVDTGCRAHPPYPQAVCTKCQPDPVTLNRQRYRHVDNISFENELLVNNFLDYWRQTGNQRIGFLIGKYQTHSDVPLGIKAVVSAIYEPPQDATSNSVSLLEDPNEDAVDDLCEAMGLYRVGWIFTDLIPHPTSPGKMKCSRHAKSYLMSAQECITAGFLQNKYPNTCLLAAEGHFGSKFVTVVAAADEQEQIHFSGYQVSNQCAALVEDDWLVPTVGAPELAYVRDDQKYVPDVKYKEKDKYGNEVSKDGRPLPVEYLLVDVPAGTPKEPLYTFHVSPAIKPFPIENRMLLEGHLQDSLRPLLEGVRDKDKEGVAVWCAGNVDWGHIKELLTAQGPVTVGTGGMDDDVIPLDAAGGGAKWACSHCTFENAAQQVDCEMCGLPRTSRN